MNVEVKKASEVSLITLVRLVNEIFQDYAVPVNWDVYNFSLDIRENSISLEDSFVFYKGERPVGFVILCTRKGIGRIDSMGVVREERGTGLSDAILRHALEHLKWKGIHRVILEVVSMDQRAVKFYERNGFKRVRDLYSYILEERLEAAGLVRFSETDEKRVYMYSLEVKMSRGRKPNWQRDSLTLYLSDKRYRMERGVWRRGEGILVWGETPQSSFIVDAFTVEGDLEFFVGECVDYIQEKSGKNVVTCTAVPEDDPLSKVLEGLGFKRILTQHEMELRLI